MQSVNRQVRHKKLIAACFIAAGVVIGGSLLLATYRNYVIEPYLISDYVEKPPAVETLLILVSDLDVHSSDDFFPRIQLYGQQARRLHKEGLIKKVLISGNLPPNEPGLAFLRRSLAEGNSYRIPARDIFLDRESDSLYESMFRAREAYQARSLILLSFSSDAVYIGNEVLGIPTYNYLIIGERGRTNVGRSRRADIDMSGALFSIPYLAVENIFRFFGHRIKDNPIIESKIPITGDGSITWN